MQKPLVYDLTTYLRQCCSGGATKCSGGATTCRSGGATDFYASTNAGSYLHVVKGNASVVAFFHLGDELKLKIETSLTYYKAHYKLLYLLFLFFSLCSCFTQAIV